MATIDIHLEKTAAPAPAGADMTATDVDRLLAGRRALATITPGSLAAAAHAAQELALVLEAGQPADACDDIALPLAQRLAEGLRQLAIL